MLLAIPFFVLAGLLMEANGMSSRLIELLMRMLRSHARRPELSSSSRRPRSSQAYQARSWPTSQPSAASSCPRCAARDRIRTKLRACWPVHAVMAETIPPCINMIILGFVANISIGGLFIAGLVPAAALALALAAVAITSARASIPSDAFEKRTPMAQLLAGALVGLVMVLMIGKGVTSGVATSTEVSAFAVVYALVVGGLAFRELSVRSVIALVRALGLDGRQHPVHRRRGLQRVLRAHDRADPGVRLGRDGRLRPAARQPQPSWQCRRC